MKSKSLDSSEFFSKILNSMQEGYVIQEKSGAIIQFNEAASKILSLTSDQLLGRTSIDPRWESLKEDGSPFPGEEHPAMQTIKTGCPTNNVVMGVRVNDGATRWININAVPIEMTLDGRTAAVLATFADITASYNERKMLSNMVRNAPGMIFQVRMDKAGRLDYLFVSQKAADIYELSEKEWQQAPRFFEEMLEPTDQAHLWEKLQQCAESLSPLEWTGRVLTKSKQVKWVSTKAIPSRLHDGRVLFDGIMMDISAQVLTQEQLVFERSRAAHTSKLASLGELSAGVAHEINNPLAIISGTVRTLNRYVGDAAKLATKIETIERSVERISKIVNGLRRFSRFDPVREKQTYPIEKVVSDITTLTEMKSHRFDTKVDFEVTTKSLVHCDPVEIEQVLINLINNGIDAVKEKPERWVKVGIFDRGADVVIRVTDSGVGVSDLVSDKLFEPFFTTKPVGEGTGLGLSISRSIIEDHGGKLSLQRDLKNTCFEISLPQARQKARDGKKDAA